MKYFCSLFLFFLAFQSYSLSFYVDPKDGSDFNSGSKDSPWRSLNHLFENGKYLHINLIGHMMVVRQKIEIIRV